MIILLAICVIAFIVSVYAVMDWTTDFKNKTLGFTVFLSYFIGMPATVIQLVKWLI